MVLNYLNSSGHIIRRRKEMTTVTLIGLVWRSFYDPAQLLFRTSIWRQARIGGTKTIGDR
jgi:hypothetical protein